MTRFVVLGAGGLGTAVGVILAAVGTDVMLITERSEDAARIARDGARVTGCVECTARPQSTTGPVRLEPCDVLLVAVKAHQTQDALDRVSGVPGAALSLQNGIEKELALIERFGEAHVLSSVIQVTASLESAGVSRCAAIEPSVVSSVSGGLTETEGTHTAAAIAGAFSAAGIPTTAVDDAAAIEWSKAAQWLPSSLLTAAAGLPLDRLLRDEDQARAYVVMAREVAAVAKAHGYELASFGNLYAADITRTTTDDAVALLRHKGESMSAGELAGYRTAMDLDLANGRPIELDATAGAMLRAAMGVGVSCPALATATAVVGGRAVGPHVGAGSR